MRDVLGKVVVIWRFEVVVTTVIVIGNTMRQYLATASTAQ
jgi:hypothetical protein